jgi:hypothetical protein
VPDYVPTDADRLYDDCLRLLMARHPESDELFFLLDEAVGQHGVEAERQGYDMARPLDPRLFDYDTALDLLGVGSAADLPRLAC